MTFSVERADKFLELAQGQANENESRNAAMMLVKLLSKAGFNFSDNSCDRSNKKFIDLKEEVDRQYRAIKSLRDGKLHLAEQLYSAKDRIVELEAEIRRLKYTSRAAESRREQAYERQEPEVTWRLITNRYESVCQKCKQPIFKNEQVYWAKGRGVVHLRCHA